MTATRQAAADGLVNRKLPRPIQIAAILGGFGVGLILISFTLLDVSLIANWIGMFLAVVAHGALAVFIVGLVLELSSQRKWTNVAGYVVSIFVLGFVLYKIDEFIFRTSPIDAGWKWFYGAFAAAAFVAVPIGMLRFLGTQRSREVLVRCVTLVLTFVAVGASLPVLLLGVLAAHRQHLSGDSSIAVPAIPGIAGRYVALGDSYSAGEGLRPFLPDQPSGCHRSDRGYPMLLKFDGEVKLDFRACAGAVTSDIDRGIVNGLTAQIDATPQTDVTLVTLTVGGNDVIFSNVVTACFIFHDCISAKFTPRATQLSRPDITYPDAQPFETWAPAAIKLLIPRLARVYDAIDKAYPNARVVVIGYPYLFPAGDAPNNISDCTVVMRRVSEHERDEVRRLTDTLNANIHTIARQHGFDFISPVDAWDGHEPCGKEDQYTNALLPVPRVLQPVDSGTFHPNTHGQQELARLVACYLIATPKAPDAVTDAPTDPPPGSLGSPIPCSDGP